MTTHQPWQDEMLGSAAADVLFGHADQLASTVISPTMDEAIVDSLRINWLDAESAWDTTKPEGTPASERVRDSRPGMHPWVAYHVTLHLQEQVAKYGTRLRRTIEQAQLAEVAEAVRGLGPRWAEESRAIEASNARQDAFYAKHDRTKAATS